MIIKIPTLDCNKCGHNWVPRIASVDTCPKCKNKRFTEEKRKYVKKRKD